MGTILTPNHGHAALMGAFGMEAMALTVMALRKVLPDEKWARPEKYIRVSFWGLNIGLALMVVGNLFPGGVLQFYDVLTNGYWHARSLAYMGRSFVRFIDGAGARRSGFHLPGGCSHGDSRGLNLLDHHPGRKRFVFGGLRGDRSEKLGVVTQRGRSVVLPEKPQK